MAEKSGEEQGWLHRHAHLPTKAVLAASAAVAACAMIGVLLGAYLHEVHAEAPQSAIQPISRTTVSTTVSTVVVTVEPSKKPQMPSDVADRKPLHRTPHPATSTTAATPTQDWTATPIPPTTAAPTCSGVVGCLLDGPKRLPDPNPDNQR